MQLAEAEFNAFAQKVSCALLNYGPLFVGSLLSILTRPILSRPIDVIRSALFRTHFTPAIVID
jgi:hypothetical protein